MMNPAGVLLFLIGALSFSGGFFDWDWFFRTRSTRRILIWMGRSGARVFYVLLGFSVMVFGGLIAFGLLG